MPAPAFRPAARAASVAGRKIEDGAMWNLVFAVGRVALVALFIKSGAEKLIDPSGLTGMLAAKAFPIGNGLIR